MVGEEMRRRKRAAKLRHWSEQLREMKENGRVGKSKHGVKSTGGRGVK